ncbi:unnamed protein product [Didymodactylos carnosus]|uniref:Uncharacterized protein n=1 Tax=Didymodactylos carnosus TaxID=1234261 RepID=A0A814H4X0_9BILA|nr:unnamed protein product [Didymodactylos carnosus]CAF1005879.1 unnamed protein product [Didymodactylos carnosus]CAF3577076.1 unnamed protein product [Didymodactylos carnosus]CAF3777191.1 unnamed protein product [Didymodactylos carnosus]
MSNVTVLLQNLQGATSVKTSNITQPRCLIYDRVQNYIVTIEQKTNSTLKRFNATTLALIDQLSLGVSGNNLLFYDNSYFLSLANNSIMVYNSSTQSLIANIYHSSITSPRDMIFIQNFLIIANTGNAQLLFFQRYSSTNYTYLKQISTTAVNPHGLHYISDSLFYLTSWYNNEIYSFSQEQYFQFGPKSQWTSMTAILPWTQTLLVPNPNSTLHGGDHVTIDDCQRGWFSFQNFGLKVYNSSWTNIADWRYVTNIFDMIFLDNYVMIMSDDNQNRLIRIDPAMAC